MGAGLTVAGWLGFVPGSAFGEMWSPGAEVNAMSEIAINLVPAAGRPAALAGRVPGGRAESGERGVGAAGHEAENYAGRDRAQVQGPAVRGRKEASGESVAVQGRAGSAGGGAVARGREVIRLEAAALALLAEGLDARFAAACDLLLAVRGRVVVCGMGKSGHVGRKIVATLAATGTPALFLHPAEAAHGDLGMVARGDVLLVLSNSGVTAELRPVLAYGHKLGVPIIGICGRRVSPLCDQADVALVLPAVPEACAANMAPTTSTALQLAMGDALAMAVMDMRGVSAQGLQALHPGGAIGLALTPVRDLMHGRADLPLVLADADMAEVISVMTRHRFGIAGVVDADGGLVGVISDGDLRRHFTRLPHATAAQVMTSPPRCVACDMAGADVLLFLNDAKITGAFVTDRRGAARPNRPLGFIHIHDLLQFGLN